MNNLTKKIFSVVIATIVLGVPSNTYATARSFRSSYKTYRTKDQSAEIADQAPSLTVPKDFILPQINDKTPIRIHERIDHQNGKIEYRWREIPYKK